MQLYYFFKKIGSQTTSCAISETLTMVFFFVYWRSRLQKHRNAWREAVRRMCYFVATVTVIDTNSRRMCTVRVQTDGVRLFFMNVYMPYEGSDSMTDEFADQLDYLISSNFDCHILVGGDFNVDLSWSCIYTAVLESFCSEADLNFTLLYFTIDVILIII
jgi:hypothetical protein